MTWENIPVEDGLFSSIRGDVLVVGMFSGPQHQEVVGEFERDEIAGVFGAKR